MIPVSEIQKAIGDLEVKKREAIGHQIGLGGRSDYHYLGREQGFEESIARLKELLPK